MLLLLLKFRGHGVKHETANIEWIIAVLLISSMGCRNCTIGEVIRLLLLKNILLFLLHENNSQVGIPINKVCSIQLFFLKNRLQTESGSVTGRHDLQH
jgi:hypothetical protein